MHCYEVIRPDGGEEKARHDGVLGRWADRQPERQQSAIFFISATKTIRCLQPLPIFAGGRIDSCRVLACLPRLNYAVCWRMRLVEIAQGHSKPTVIKNFR